MQSEQITRMIRDVAAVTGELLDNSVEFLSVHIGPAPLPPVINIMPGAWRSLFDFPSADLPDVKQCAQRLFSHGPQPQRLRIRDHSFVLCRTDFQGGLLVWVDNPLPTTTATTTGDIAA